MVSVRLEKAFKRFGQTRALDGVSLDIRSGEFFFLLGPSGCGKTTLLRAIAGLGLLDSGDVFFDDRKMDEVPAHRRNAALVFQNYALWPHMSVFDNVAYGLVERKVPKAERKKRVDETLDLVRLSKVSDRKPSGLSGGQQQRVALARALVVRPDVVLLDEPLSNLDAHLRNEMRYELKRIQAETGVTMIYVTHDQQEALSMAHTIAVLKEGKLRQVGSPESLYQDPTDIFVAGFVGRTNLVAGKVVAEAQSSGFGPRLQVETPLGKLWGRTTQQGLEPGQQVVCSIRPEAVRVVRRDAEKSHASAEEQNRLRGAKLLRRLFMGELEERFYELAGQEVQSVELAPRGAPPRSGDLFDIRIDSGEVVVLAHQPGEEMSENAHSGLVENVEPKTGDGKEGS